MNNNPIFSAGEDVKQASEDVGQLLTTSGGRWSLNSDKKGVERQFRFKTFKRTWEFMNAIAAECKSQRHHPEWSNVYNHTHIRWTTHNPSGLSTKDIRMARFCDEQAQAFGEILPTKPTGPLESGATKDAEGSVLRELTNTVAQDGGECCTSKKSSS